MSDGELIARLRGWARDIQEGSKAIWAMDQDLKEAADRIEALVKERDDALEELSACTGGTGGCGYWREAAKRQETCAEQLAATNKRLEAAMQKAIMLAGQPHYGDRDDATLDHCFDAIDVLRATLKGADHE